jgi:hypothetical protein
MDPRTQFYSQYNRRDILKSGALSLLQLAIPAANSVLQEPQPMTANGDAGAGLDRHARTNHLQDGLEINRRTCEL